jgi:hypothetical protein
VAVDAEDLLNDDYGATGRAGGWRKPGAKLMAIASHDGGELGHEEISSHCGKGLNRIPPP